MKIPEEYSNLKVADVWKFFGRYNDHKKDEIKVQEIKTYSRISTEKKQTMQICLWQIAQ